MKILITNHELIYPQGSELVVFDLAKELTNKRMKVIVYSPFCGEVAEKIRANGIEVVENLGRIRGIDFDIIHAQHNVTAIQARYFFPTTPMVFLSHGILPFLEQPPSIDINIQKYLAVSEEVKNNLTHCGIDESKIVIFRNFADTERFTPKSEIYRKLKRILVISNSFYGEVEKVIKEACQKLELKLEVIGAQTKRVWNVEDYINNADIVITLGRGAIEAMACGRAVIVYGCSMGVVGDGIITEENVKEIEKNNFSGRRYKRKYTGEELAQELKKYNSAMGIVNRRIVLEKFNLKKRSGELLEIYKSAIDEFMPRQVLIPQKELNRYLGEIQRLHSELGFIYKSKAWKVAITLRKIKHIFFPKKNEKEAIKTRRSKINSFNQTSFYIN